MLLHLKLPYFVYKPMQLLYQWKLILAQLYLQLVDHLLLVRMLLMLMAHLFARLNLLYYPLMMG